MRPNRSVAVAPAVALAAVLGLLGSTAVAEEPPPAKRYQVVSPMKEGLNITGINGRGDVVGFHWEPENGDPNILYEAPFLAKGDEIVRLPLLKTYTATFPAAVSDDGVVVGRVSKPAPFNVYVYLRNQAFAWTAEKGIVGLGAPDRDGASFATGISRDGRRISGVGVGDYRLRAVLWERDGDGWKSVLVPDAEKLGSNVVAISPDGKRLAAVNEGVATLWTEAAPGEWRREILSPEPNAMTPRGVNDSGMVVGVRNDFDGTLRAVIWTREKGMETLAVPEGFQHAQASAVNNAGVVVGQIDGPRGQDPGPRAFAYEGGKLRILDEGGPDFSWATVVNDSGMVAGVLEHEEDEPHDAPPPAEAPKKP